MMPENGGIRAHGQVLQSATRTLSALDALGHYPNGATAKALSADLGLKLSTTYHVLNTLVAAGYAVQDPLNRHFFLGARIPHLHQAFLSSMQPPPGSLALLQALQEATQETIHLGRLHGQDVMIVALVAGTHDDAVPPGYVGLSGPAHAVAIGQAILAALPSTLLERFLAEADLSARSLFPASDVSTLRRELERVRERGYAVDRGDRSTGLAGCLAAAIGRDGRSIPDAVSIMAPRSRFVRDEETLRAAVMTIAQATSALGQALPSEESVRRKGSGTLSDLEQAVAALRLHPLADDRR